ncbi:MULTISPECIES: MATE family efflux transporter [Mesoflavibacter]|uniref:Multidrug-efflux transporter n=1 Tax=Mesoflavibacter profundi TaxID=2708110 RepID=A0ABT4S1S0_9FLAO|nr:MULTISPECIES: MATE family efflux transporter [Mesoflavibacter]MDA0178017.1 MATE family efflux transporter [Mesoflavibacter profundi]QIJ88978.1 DNA-damage-inducible protein F [Mesoflavibacter sp. HG96]QIJ91706.1 DNA-damage-inducible protein F [Mesoflavibacter sp. HG37]
MTTDISLNKINKLAIPALIAGISEPILSLTDAAVIGNVNLNPTESLAAIGIVTTFISMLIWVLGQTRSAISSIISQHLGANTLDKVRQLPAQAIFLITALSIFIIVITYPFASNIFKLYNAENIILDYSVEYYRIRVIGFPFTLFVIAVFGTFRGLQNTFYPMVIAIIGAALNVILDFLLVYGIDGVFEGLHIKGAAYASVIAQLIMAVIAGFLLLTKTSIPLRFTLPFNPQIKNFTLMILNLFVRTLALNITLYFATKYATGYGKNYIAAYTIAINLWFLGAFIIDGYASAGNILSGKLLGEKNYNTLINLSNKLIKYGILLGVFVAIIASLFYYQIGTIFTKEQAVLEKFYSVFWIVLAMQPLCALAFIFDGMYKGLGKMKVLRNVLLLSTFLVFIPILWITDHYNLKLHGIFIAFTLWIIARGIPLIIIFRKQFLPLTQNN